MEYLGGLDAIQTKLNAMYADMHELMLTPAPPSHSGSTHEMSFHDHMLDVERELRDPTTDARAAKDKAELIDEDIKNIDPTKYRKAALCGKRVHSSGLEEVIMMYRDIAGLLGE